MRRDYEASRAGRNSFLGDPIPNSPQVTSFQGSIFPPAPSRPAGYSTSHRAPHGIKKGHATSPFGTSVSIWKTKGLSSLGQKPALSSQAGRDSPGSAPGSAPRCSVCLGLTLRGLACLASQADAKPLEGGAALHCSEHPLPSGWRPQFS